MSRRTAFSSLRFGPSGGSKFLLPFLIAPLPFETGHRTLVRSSPRAAFGSTHRKETVPGSVPNIIQIFLGISHVHELNMQLSKVQKPGIEYFFGNVFELRIHCAHL